MNLSEIKNRFATLKKKQKKHKLLAKIFALGAGLMTATGFILLSETSFLSLSIFLTLTPLCLMPGILPNLANDHFPWEKLNQLNEEENYLEFLNLSLFLMISSKNTITQDKLSEYESIKEKISYNSAFKTQKIDELPQKIQNNIQNNTKELKEYFSQIITHMYELNIFQRKPLEDIEKLTLEQKEALIQNYLINLKEKVKIDEKKAIEIEKSLGIGNKETQKALALKL